MFFWGVLYYELFFIPKLMKFFMVFSFFGSFAYHFQLKLSTHGSNLNSIFVIMSELEFFLLMRVLTQNFNTVYLVKFLDKKQKLHI
jgi:1-acyl-sn-glycerol-3-phosphate acyltransferase